MSISEAFLALELRRAMRLLERIAMKVDAISAHDHVEDQQMATVVEALQAVADAVSGLESDVQRVLDALANENISPEAQQVVDQLKARVDAMNAALDSAVPPATPGEPTGDDSLR